MTGPRHGSNDSHRFFLSGVRGDSRCGGGWGLFTDDAGDLYALGNAWFGFAHFFDRDPSRQPNDCLLRIPAGSSEFDPDFYLELSVHAGG
jgi:hypothetical protein